MKNHLLYYFFVLFCLSESIKAQTVTATEIGRETIKTASLEEEEFSSITYEDNNTTAMQFADTKGELTISPSGSSSYKVPIALPPGIRDVAPQIALVYDSSGSNGIAGYGWNIAGVSSIARISKRIDLDGYVDGVDFNDDVFALDGQRLIFPGETAQRGTPLVTENYTNSKIMLYGSYRSPDSFTVTSPDGSQAFYGATENSRGVSEWLISKWSDPQGNTIEYTYEHHGSVTYISEIKWGKNTNVSTSYENTMSFQYKTRERPEQAYLHGISMTNSKILDFIEVKTNGDLFKRYKLTHTSNSLKYQNLSQVQEFNANNESANPVVFNYENSGSDVVETFKRYPKSFNFGFDSVNNPEIHSTGDFDGDGNMDVIADGKLILNIFQFNQSNSTITDLNKSSLLKTPIVTLHNNRLAQAQSVVQYSASRSHGSMNQYPNLERDHTISLSPQILNTTTKEFTTNYMRTFKYPHLNRVVDRVGCMNVPNFDQYNGEADRKYTEGDFDGDGISDFIIRGKYTVNETFIDDPYPPFDRRPEPGCGTRKFEYDVPAYYVNMNPLIPDDESFKSLSTLAYEDELYTIDFDGDGKNELFKLNKNGYYKVYTVNNKGIIALEEVTSGRIEYRNLESSSRSNETDVILINDFNGDGKTDFIVPTAENSSVWKLYKSTGTEYIASTVYLDEYKRFVSKYKDRDNYYYNYYTLDINGDGKGDFVKTFTKIRSVPMSNDDRDTGYSISAKENNIDNGQIVFTHIYDSGVRSDDTRHPPLFIPGNYRDNRSSYQMVLLNDYRASASSPTMTELRTFEFQKNQSKDKRLKSVSESGGKIVSNITYEPLVPNSANGGMGDVNGIYHSINWEQYPYVEIKTLPNVSVVSKLSVSAMGKTKEREFKYRGLVSHAHGLGILGFKSVSQSSWTTAGINNKIWSVNRTSPQLRGATVLNYTFAGNNINLITSPDDNSLLSKTTQYYKHEILPDKRYVILPSTTFEKDFITDVETFTENWYNSKYNVQRRLVEDGVSTHNTYYTYANNQTGSGSQYYVGRLTRQIDVFEAYDDRFQTEENYYYTGNLITQTKKKGNNTDFIIENLQYDIFGNVTQKTISAPGVSVRTIKSEYEPTGRFVKKKTDSKGLVTTLTYNNLGQVLTQTDPFGVTVTSQFDSWGKLLKTTTTGSSASQIITNYTYERMYDGGWSTTSSSPQTRSYSNTLNDVLGRQIKSTVKGFDNGTYISKSTEWDFLGRKTRESEPYFSTGSPTQWNTTTYDYLNRPTRITSFTGVNANISYNGLSATTTQNGKTKTITKDTAGNVIQVIDNTETINYNYYANGKLKSSNYNNHTVSIKYDGWGNKIELLDPTVSSTPYTYVYNNYGEIIQENTPDGYTLYEYSPTGELLNKIIVGNNSETEVSYTYNPLGQITVEEGRVDKNYFKTRYYYDSRHNLNRTIEESNIGTPNLFKVDSRIVYDGYSRVLRNRIITSVNNNQYSSDAWTTNVYNTYNGMVEEIKDYRTNQTIWKLTGANERMQTISEQFGNGINIANAYNSFGYIESIQHQKTGASPALSLTYSFNAQKGTLNNRKNNFYNWTENFTYDNFDRLLTWSSPDGTNSNTYLTDGRINNNSKVGDYEYNNNARYKKESIQLNSSGANYYSSRQLQQIVFNADKKPLTITEEGRGKIEFGYNIYGTRNIAKEYTNNRTTPRYTNLYSSNGAVEVKLNSIASLASGEILSIDFVKIITYVGGNAYTAPAMHVTNLNYNGDKVHDKYYYLHRDFQGSIMAISNQEGIVIERRHYDPWGNIVKFTNAKGTTRNNPDLTGGDLFFNRGYTGHEHFFRVGIIHMNGRVYDPILKTFLSPDNYIQDPQNSQNFNRYGYAYNNPLMYTDPSGEFFMIAGSYALGAAVVGAILGAGTYIYTQLATPWVGIDAGGLLKSTIIGAISAVAAYGVGEAAGAIFPNAVATATQGASKLAVAGKAVTEAVMNGITQALITGVSGGDLAQTFVSAAISSVVSSAVTIGGGELLGEFGESGAATILFGTVSGGLGAELTNGNFWQGAATGFIVSAFNHVAHRVNKSILNARIDSQFKGTGMSPDGEVPNTLDELLTEATKVKESLPELVRLDEQAEFPGIELGRENTINLRSKNIVIKHMANSYTYRQLAITIGHELIHMTHYVLGYRPSGWSINNNYTHNYSEYLAYKWEIKWGGNINYGSHMSPNQWMKYHFKLSGNLPNIYGK